jgi:biopolymer transport protein ExbD
MTKSWRMIRFTGGMALTAAVFMAVGATSTVAQDVGGQRAGGWGAVEQALGRKGAMQPGDVMRFSFPRRDLQVTARGVRIRPAFALGSWVAFKDAGGGHAMVMGDLVLTEDEVNAVISRLQQGGIEQTALHNHVLDESPRVMYLHISAHANPESVARTIRAALETPLDTATAASATAPLELDTAQIARTLGHAGRVNGGVYQVSVPRAERITEGGREVPASMGLATVINFQSTGSDRAAITGDFVMTAREVNPVIRALRENGIEVTALHSHMLAEQPRLFFMHFWANDDVLKLARGLRAALDRTATRTAGR